MHSPDSFLPLRRPCPGVVTVHDLAFEAIPHDMRGATAWKYRTFLPRCARSAERVICPSRFTAQDLSERYEIPSERIRVIPEAPALAPGAQPSPEGPYLLSAGDLRPKKNLPLLIDLDVALFGGNNGSGYLLTNVLLPISPNSGTGTFDINFVNNGGQQPTISHLLLAGGNARRARRVPRLRGR